MDANRPRPCEDRVVGIRRAVPNLLAADLDAGKRFYTDFLGFEVAMDLRGFAMLRSPSNPTAQIILSSPGGETDDPQVGKSQMTVEVADVDAVHADAVHRGLEIAYPLTDEPWGIRRFFVKDPDGTVINVAMHIEPPTA